MKLKYSFLLQPPLIIGMNVSSKPAFQDLTNASISKSLTAWEDSLKQASSKSDETPADWY